MEQAPDLPGLPDPHVLRLGGQGEVLQALREELVSLQQVGEVSNQSWGIPDEDTVSTAGGGGGGGGGEGRGAQTRVWTRKRRSGSVGRSVGRRADDAEMSSVMR